MSESLLPDDGPDMAAAELALGLLDGEERAVALRRVLAEPGFARSVEDWRGYLGQLFDLWPERDAPIGLFARIERSLDAPAAPARQPARFWPALAALTSIAAAAMLVFVIVHPNPVPIGPVPTAVAPARMLVASLAPMENDAVKGAPIAAVYEPAHGMLHLTQAAAPATGRSAELWVIGADATPHSLGLLKAGTSTSMEMPMPMRAHMAAGATLAITIEPEGGSPNGKPTGPMIAKGGLSTI